LNSHGRGHRALLAISAAIAAATVAPAAANAAVSVTVTGDDGNPVALGGTLNIRNMSPQLAITASATPDRWSVSATGPNGALVSSDTGCTTGSQPTKYVDYVGNGTYTVTLKTYASDCTTVTGTQSLPFTITASTAITPPPIPELTRVPGTSTINTVTLPIDLNPGALSTDVFVERNVTPNPDGSLPGTPEQVFPDTTAKTIAIRLDKGPGVYAVAARAKGYAGTMNPQAFGPWATPVAIRAFAPFDLQTFTWTDQRGPSYRFSAVIRATGATGRVNVAIGRGTKGKYRSLGTARISRHRFSKRFRLSGRGTYRIRFKYKGNATVAGGFEVRKFRIERRVFFRGVVAPGRAVARGSAIGR
jgi:hypothetical protein